MLLQELIHWYFVIDNFQSFCKLIQAILYFDLSQILSKLSQPLDTMCHTIYVKVGLKLNRATSVPKSILRHSSDKGSNSNLVF